MTVFAPEKLWGLLLASALVVLASLSSAASGTLAFTEPGLTGTPADFANCPADITVSLAGAKCVHSYTTDGVIQIGHSTVPISVPGDTLDLGAGGEDSPALSPLHGVLNGPAQPVPGGVLGTIGNIPLTAVYAKLEWAPSIPPRTVFGVTTYCGTNPLTTFDVCRVISNHPGVAATLKAKIHLISPFLGASCYIGSAASPIVIALTTGITDPPAPTRPIEGHPANFIRKSGNFPLETSSGLRLVNNTFSVPVASGCGTSTGGLLNASIDHKLGLPSPPGQNAITLNAVGELLAPAFVLADGWTGE